MPIQSGRTAPVCRVLPNITGELDMIGELRARLTTLASALIMGSLVATPSTALAAAVHVCGTVATYTAANGEQEGVLSLRTSQATFTYLLSGGGSRGPRVEPAAVAPGASACVSGELVLSARPPSHEVLIDFDIVVPAGGLPNTSTADQSPWNPPFVFVVVLSIGLGAVRAAWLVINAQHRRCLDLSRVK